MLAFYRKQIAKYLSDVGCFCGMFWIELKAAFCLPCINITYCPTTFELLDIVPREGPLDELVPDLNKILVVCCRSSIVMVSSGVVCRAKGQIKL
jgi:hypothetical protein